MNRQPRLAVRARVSAPLIVALLHVVLPTASAQLTSPQVGWQTELSRKFHNVSGTVKVLDENTIQVDKFTYDGFGISVYFYLGQENTRNAFLAGLRIGPQLLGTAYNGTQPPLLIDLPAGQTLQGWNAVSVWCDAVGSSFGDGTFAPATAHDPGDFNDDGSVDAADYVAWRNGLGTQYLPTHYNDWRANFGASSTAAPNPGAFPMGAVPEPVFWPWLVGAVAVWVVRRHRAR